jgi:hypothetical protein
MLGGQIERILNGEQTTYLAGCAARPGVNVAATYNARSNIPPCCWVLRRRCSAERRYWLRCLVIPRLWRMSG